VAPRQEEEGRGQAKSGNRNLAWPCSPLTRTRCRLTPAVSSQPQTRPAPGEVSTVLHAHTGALRVDRFNKALTFDDR
jgi:hypothetical protein